MSSLPERRRPPAGLPGGVAEGSGGSPDRLQAYRSADEWAALVAAGTWHQLPLDLAPRIDGHGSASTDLNTRARDVQRRYVALPAHARAAIAAPWAAATARTDRLADHQVLHQLEMLLSVVERRPS